LTGPEKAGLKKVTEQEVLDALKVNSEELNPMKTLLLPLVYSVMK
jgi:hypothetical protein